VRARAALACTLALVKYMVMQMSISPSLDLQPFSVWRGNSQLSVRQSFMFCSIGFSVIQNYSRQFIFNCFAALFLVLIRVKNRYYPFIANMPLKKDARPAGFDRWSGNSTVVPSVKRVMAGRPLALR
jgi:hypothetical protein